MPVDSINSLYEMLTRAHCDYLVFDTGRIIQPISKSDFEAFEDQKTPYSYPIAQTARFALIYWNQHNRHNPFIWFLEMPLDEESMLNLGARNHFMAIITEALGNQFAEQDGQGEQQAIPDNPYIKPPEEKKRAILNAKVKQAFVQPMGKEHQACADYFNQPEPNKWRQLSVQGMADFCVLLNDPAQQKKLENSYFNLEIALQTELVSFLEHSVISRAFARRLCRAITQLSAENIDSTDAKAIITRNQQVVNHLRALSHYSKNEEVAALISQFCQSNLALNPDVLSVIAGRLWQCFTHEGALINFLEHIATHPQEYVFNALFADLVAIPVLRTKIFSHLQASNVLPKTRLALTQMVKNNHGSTH